MRAFNALSKSPADRRRANFNSETSLSSSQAALQALHTHKIYKKLHDADSKK